jgi:hypothetical protein
VIGTCCANASSEPSAKQAKSTQRSSAMKRRISKTPSIYKEPRETIEGSPEAASRRSHFDALMLITVAKRDGHQVMEVIQVTKVMQARSF